MSVQRPPLPPFTFETATEKVRRAEDAWNTRNPDIVTPAYSDHSEWRNRATFLKGHADIHAFLTAKWQREQEYRLIKGLWTFAENRIAVRFAYEWHDAAGQWHRSYGNENWQFDADGRMERRIASINDLEITEKERLFHWALGRRPEGHPGLEDLNL
ncbi:nuclear transport factor 2 family protein [Shimia marina]|uniref:SnoaL-like domain protein n=1 Tax=Shimia marina TaxID=321267 RepID=A0A0P1ELU5_9RHOB|nr:nuclear transport factor 2 family protein [Shimia marina]CUH51417.1 hypothetical protein SHM7688_00854 [Shimia marina]SFD49726.1 hypothetical protein SAMN04488037_101252 [Shimia marina]